jgi:hypothetical protein
MGWPEAVNNVGIACALAFGITGTLWIIANIASHGNDKE